MFRSAQVRAYDDRAVLKRREREREREHNIISYNIIVNITQYSYYNTISIYHNIIAAASASGRPRRRRAPAPTLSCGGGE